MRNQKKEVRECGKISCNLHPYRLGTNPNRKRITTEEDLKDEKYLPPVKSIRKHCLECYSGSPKDVKLCDSPECPLYPFRLGTNPNRKSRTITDEEKKEKVEILRKARSLKKEKKDSQEQ